MGEYKTIGVRLPVVLYSRLLERCGQSECSPSEFVRLLLEEELKPTEVKYGVEQGGPQKPAEGGPERKPAPGIRIV